MRALIVISFPHHHDSDFNDDGSSKALDQPYVFDMLNRRGEPNSIITQIINREVLPQKDVPYRRRIVSMRSIMHGRQDAYLISRAQYPPA